LYATTVAPGLPLFVLPEFLLPAELLVLAQVLAHGDDSPKERQPSALSNSKIGGTLNWFEVFPIWVVPVVGLGATSTTSPSVPA
jgi:hypothetical protein